MVVIITELGNGDRVGGIPCSLLWFHHQAIQLCFCVIRFFAVGKPYATIPGYSNYLSDPFTGTLCSSSVDSPVVPTLGLRQYHRWPFTERRYFD